MIIVYVLSALNSTMAPRTERVDAPSLLMDRMTADSWGTVAVNESSRTVISRFGPWIRIGFLIILSIVFLWYY